MMVVVEPFMMFSTRRAWTVVTVATILVNGISPAWVEGFAPPLQVSHHKRTTSVSRFLFFKARDKETRNSLLEQLSSPDLKLPYSSTLQGRGGRNRPPSEVTFRWLTKVDQIDQIANLCVEEYGPDNGTKNLSILDQFSKQWENWWDISSLRLLVWMTCFLKMQSDSDNNNPLLPDDHAIILATVLSDASNIRKEVVVGMIELSRQPPIPSRSPGPVPIPLWVKELYYQWLLRTGSKELDKADDENTSTVSDDRSPLPGWISNVLVAPSMRGQGIAACLVTVAEGIARNGWGSKAIHLHCDASPSSGSIPQRLYQGMGYGRKSSDELRWARTASDGETFGPNPMESSVYIIDGVPLLYLKKSL